MAEEQIRSFARDIAKAKTATMKAVGRIVDKEEAENMVIDYLSKNKVSSFDMEQSVVATKTATKEDMRIEKEHIRTLITSCIFSSSIQVRDCEIEDFINEMVSEYGGYSALDEAFEDDEVSDIYCLSWDNIFVEKAGKNMRYWKKFKSEEHYGRIVERFLRFDGKELNIGDHKIVDAELYGDRLCATSKAVTPNGITLTIRKHKEVQITLDEMMEQHVMTDEMKELFGLIIDGESNLIYAGITGSGKTTTIRALLDDFVPKNGKRMVVVEDTQELFPKNPHTMQMISTKSDKDNLAISLYDLIITALRLKPKYIVVGEVRGEEAAAAVEAMETGHSTIFTMHGGTVWNNINRLVTKYLMKMPSLGTDVVERIIGAAVDYIAIQDDVPGWGRVVSSIDEISYDFHEKRIKVRHIFKFDQIQKEFVFLNRISPDKADKMMRRGIPVERIKDWVMEGTDAEPAFSDTSFVEKVNEKYLKEKEERHKNYEAQRAARLEARKHQNGDAHENPINADEKEKEKIDMIKKLEDLKLSVLISEAEKKEGDGVGTSEVGDNES